jgi:threonyl-tRNA synthetase
LVPVNDEMVPLCEEMVSKLPGVRVDIDDTDSTIGKKVRNAAKEWIPFIIVIGEKEKESGELGVRVRGQKEPYNTNLEEFGKMLTEKQGDMPWRPLAVPMMVSKRIIFRG